jgi:hypothetical protein
VKEQFVAVTSMPHPIDLPFLLNRITLIQTAMHSAVPFVSKPLKSVKAYHGLKIQCIAIMHFTLRVSSIGFIGNERVLSADTVSY